MKSLDEVKRALSICMDKEKSCDGCPYESQECRTKRYEDILYYLNQCCNTFENKPLTLEELKSTRDTPVWIEDEDGFGYWDIYERSSEDGYLIFARWCKMENTYGNKWEAYDKEGDYLSPVQCGCGGEAKIRSSNDGYYVLCDNCLIQTSKKETKREAIRTWNKAIGSKSL